VVDTELTHDRLNPNPGPQAEAQLAALKGAAPGTQRDTPSGAQDTSHEGADQEDAESATSGEDTAPRKTL